MKEQLAGQQNIPVFLRQHWQKETGFAFPSGHTMFAASWRFWRGSVMAAQTDFHHRVFVSLGDRRNGQPFASGNALAARFSGRHAHLLAISYPGDLAGAANLRAAYAPREEAQEIAEREQES
ncbi:phosphatidylglycerophosphatase B [Salmonella enterica subsp. enterica]|uniref:Phosphatidylglycerophosphatase B n=1 Tax=Salmonella enterica I TaxID=59201 RepID=A0A379URF2_SALET|nr:phosphatidylglycerophosphatase B [Salmonella enterica subsp. enterica]